ncbi:MAG: glycine cleavage system aminomethyltransferase GcvT [Candidatus Thermoplasmatota archaeon]|nr:glycine cleavage system aminomethyltransferase GcvT [Candidatus Thermoplasmatota archaeon]
MSDDDLVRTALYDAHVERGGNIVDFHGFELPIWYSSMMDEHLNTRENAGLFDVSHMGFFRFSGDGVREWFDRIGTQKASTIGPGRCAYTHFLDDKGIIIDDMIFCVVNETEILGVPNASMVDRMWEHFHHHIADGITIENISSETSILALQGPKSPDVLETVLGAENVVRHFRGQSISNNDLGITGWIQGTGYTGERGFEIFVPNTQVKILWDALLDQGGNGICPVGLGARDTLRMEKGFLLSGQDFCHPDLGGSDYLARDTAETFVPFGLNMDHDFIGRPRVESTKAMQLSGSGIKWLGLKVTGKGPFPRMGHAVLKDGVQIGSITSGGPSPSLGKVGIGLAYLEGVEVGEEVEIAVNPRRNLSAIVVRPPFI